MDKLDGYADPVETVEANDNDVGMNEQLDEQPGPSCAPDGADAGEGWVGERQIGLAFLNALPCIDRLNQYENNRLNELAHNFSISNTELLVSRPIGQWLVKGVLPADSLALLAGAPGVGKSFLTLDLSLRIVHGLEWHNRRTLAGAVFYIAAEGSVGIGKRLRAWHQHHGIAYNKSGLFVVDRAVQLTKDNVVELATLVHLCAQAAGLPPRMIVIDTLARCATGVDENSAKDMGRLVETAESLRLMTKTTVLLVHHLGKDASRGPRGSNSLVGAVEASILVTKSNGILHFHTDKQKEEQGRTVMSRLEQVILGPDEDGDLTTSCVPVEVEGDAGNPSPTADTSLTEKQRSVIDLLGVAIDSRLGRTELRRQFRKANPSSTRPKDYADTITQLERRGIIQIEPGDQICLVFAALVPASG